MATDYFYSDVQINGGIGATTVTVPQSSISDLNVEPNAAIAVTKRDHLHKLETNFGIEADAAPSTGTTYTFMVFVASGACKIRLFKAMMVDTGTQANTNDFTFDLKKGAVGAETLTTALSAVITIDSDTVDNTPSAATISTTTLVAGDCLVIEAVTPATVTAAHGMHAWVELSEAAN